MRAFAFRIDPPILTTAAMVLAAASTQACGSSDDSECPVGSEGCPCTSGGVCDPGLTCASDLCVDLADAGAMDAGDTDGAAPEDGGGDAAGDAPVCGDGVVNGDEECDGPVTNGTCEMCSIECNEGFGDCNGEPLDGCESDFDVDPYNCGGCGTECDPGQVCISESCDATIVTRLLVADSQGTVSDMVRDDQHVYWSGSDTAGYVRRWSHAAGGSADDVATDLATPYGMIAVDSSHVYGATCGGASDTIYRVPKSGGTPSEVHSVGDTIECESAIAVDDENVYFAVSLMPTLGVPSLEVRAVPKGGGAAVEMLSASYAALTDLAQDDTHLYGGIAQAAGGFTGIYAIQKSDGTMEEVVTTRDVVTDVFELGDDLYFVDVDPELDATGSILRMSKDGSSFETYATGQMNPSDVVAYDSRVYWTNQGRTMDGADDGVVASAPIEGGAVEVVSSGEARPQHLAVTNDDVVWVSHADGDAMVVRASP